MTLVGVITAELANLLDEGKMALAVATGPHRELLEVDQAWSVKAIELHLAIGDG